jgi:hypothetical protein
VPVHTDELDAVSQPSLDPGGNDVVVPDVEEFVLVLVLQVDVVVVADTKFAIMLKITKARTIFFIIFNLRICFFS